MSRAFSIAALLSSAVLNGFLVVGSAMPGHAEFIRTSPGVFQHTGKHLKVIVSHEIPGIFVLAVPSLDLQVFDPAIVAREGAQHIFIRYNPELDRYSAIVIGPKEYRVRGGLTIEAQIDSDSVRLAVDNNNPYLSILIDSSAKETSLPPSLLGFRGTELVVNETGQKKVALLEANRFNQFQAVIEPYLLTSAGLALKGAEIAGSTVGVEIEPPKNFCLRSGTIFVSQKDLLRIKNIKQRDESVEQLEKLISGEAPPDPLKGVLLLRIEPTEMIGLDYSSGIVKIIRPLKKVPKPLCSIEDIPLEE